MVLLELGTDELKKKQAEAEKGQHEVGPFLRWIGGSANSVKRRTKELPEFEKRVADMKAELVAKTKERDDALRARDAAKKELDATRAAERKEKDNHKRDELRKQVKRIEGAIREHEKKRRDAENRTGWLKRELDKYARMVAEHKAKLPEEVKKRDELIHVARNIQTGAYWKQKDTIDAIRESIKNLPAETEKKNDVF